MTTLVAVTGATGFIGRAICKHLLKGGYSVRALVRNTATAEKLRQQGIELCSGSLEDHASLERLVAGAKAVVHCAGAVRGATAADFDRVNVDGAMQLVDAVKAQRAPPALLVLSSLAAREPQLSFYAASKFKLESLLQEQASDLRWLALRPPAVYGPGDKELLPLFRAMAKGIAPVPGSPAARFSMLFVDDLAEAVLAWLKTEHPDKGVYSIDDGRAGGYNWHDVANIVAGLCQRRVRILPLPTGLLNLPARLNRLAARRFGYAPMLTPEKLNELRHPDWVCDSEALTTAIGWQPKTQLEAGLRRTPGWCSRLTGKD